MTSRTILCRCEDITLEEVLDAIARGFRDPESLKRFTAYATGPCQGKECIPLALAVLARETGADPAAFELPTLRSPVMPVCLGALARLPPPDGPRKEERR